MLNQKIKLDYNGELETYIIDSQISHNVHKKRPAIIICPGGGYMKHAKRESEPVALDFMQKGYHCFILRYSVAMDGDRVKDEKDSNLKYPIQVLQLMESIHIVKEKAESWFIDSDQIYIMGFSAGGHVCASLGVRWNDETLTNQLSFIPKKNELRPTGMILGYPMLSDNTEEFNQLYNYQFNEKTLKVMNNVLYQTDKPSQSQIDSVNLINYISKDTIPTFIWHSVDDCVVDSRNSTKFIEKLVEYNIPCEYHLFGHGTHGKSLSNELTSMNEDETDRHLNLWTLLSHYWMKKNRRN